MITPFPIATTQTLQMYVPEQQLLSGSVQISAQGKPLTEWSQEDHILSYSWIKDIVPILDGQTPDNPQYMVYGKAEAKSFTWEVVPYQPCKNSVTGKFLKVVQQIRVLWNTCFGGRKVPDRAAQEQQERYKKTLQGPHVASKSNSLPSVEADAFRTQKVIDRQWVIQGKKVNILYNYAPVGIGERLHFLVVPKAHRLSFTDISKEEYCEALQLTEALMKKVLQSSQKAEVTLFHKTGTDAGQTIPHWHMHVIFSTSPSDSVMSRLTVFKNILLGSSPMNKEEFEQRVAGFRKQFLSDPNKLISLTTSKEEPCPSL